MTSHTRNLSRAVGLCALLLGGVAAVGCGDDSQRAATDGGFRDGALPEPGKPTKDRCYSDSAKGGEDAALSEEARCVCDQCLKEASACHADQGCMQIHACMERTACYDMNDCYFGKAPCRAEIDAWGIMSFALSLAQKLSDCAVASKCVVVPEIECSVVGEFKCDGDEDCSTGQRCCGHFNGAMYDGSACASTCTTPMSSDASITESAAPLCHPGEECAGQGQSCLSYALLPDFLYRCEDTGSVPQVVGSKAKDEVNCGDEICGKAEKCCVRLPKKPYCANVAESCECHLPTDMTGKDAGMMSMDDAGSDDAGR